ncbi:MAG: hypothetical protein AAF993_12650, partial [Pseudomonadota bacterium]
MRKHICAALVRQSLSSVAAAATYNIACSECRAGNATDVGNFAYNQAFGVDRWISWKNADVMNVTTVGNVTYRVDLNFNVNYQNTIGFSSCFLGICINFGIPNYLGTVNVSVWKNGVDVKNYNLLLQPRTYHVGPSNSSTQAQPVHPNNANVNSTQQQLLNIRNINPSLPLGWGVFPPHSIWALTGYAPSLGTPVFTFTDCAWSDL